MFSRNIGVIFAKKMKTFHTIKNGNETYIYYLDKLIHKTRNNNSESGVTFDVMAYRKYDSLKSIK